MHKVLLVDDELFVRKGLMNLIDWKSLGYEICGEAESGQEALDIMEQVSPDLVITDIRMPVLDGLDLIRTVTTEWRKVPVFIIISGYHDFKYAQQALRYNVHDYLLKPIDEVELENTLKKLVGTISAKKLTGLTGNKLAAGSVLESLIKGDFREEDAGQYAAALHMEEESRYAYVLAEIHPKGMDGAQTDWSVKEVAAALQEIVDRTDCEIPSYEHDPGLYGLLLDTKRLAKGDSKLEAIYRSVHAALSRAKDAPVTLYVGKTVELLHDVKESYRSASKALSYKYAEDGAAVIDIGRMQETPLYYFDIEPAMYTKLFEHIEENDKEAYLSVIDNLFAEFKEKRFASNAVSNTITRCVIGVIKIIRDMESDEKGLESLPGIMEWQNRHVRLQELKQLFTHFIYEASAYIAELRREQSKGGIEKIKKYIETNYNENISLKSIAAKFFMNPVYLGQLFRKTYGVYFNDFLLGLRVQEAKKLLRVTDLRMYEVAERVGFQSADYFVTQFEKLEKLTPTEYRNKLINKL
ncbi:response regulator transcription factor [Paenibacillus abyssi]|uniref:AraC family transcriptional regulator n=1 Tax=Paenibacillus abyssi TaxID=1340531 RepID=A0A917CPH5_9BACL|nr:response regulator [Paenibacillus abyssi]GGF94879.1 AraC family transcriptional regulator [Paenibacillus abyssi]